MKFAVAFISFVVLSSFAIGQDISTPQHYIYKIDSISRFQWSRDSMKVAYWADSLKSKVFFRFDRDSIRLASRIDSLEAIAATPDSYLGKMDSLIKKKDELINEVDSRRGQALSETKGRIDDWKGTIESRLKMNELPNAPDLGVTDIGQLQLPKALSDMQLPAVPELDLTEIKNFELSADLRSLNEAVSFEKLGDMPLSNNDFGGGSLTESVSGLKNVIKDPGAALEQTATSWSELGKVTNELEVANLAKDEVIQKMTIIKNPENVKEVVKQEVLEQASNHFAGKEGSLTAALDKVQRYKAKYAKLGSIDDIKKLPKNQMRGKPFIERSVLGNAFQFQKNDFFLVDINPYFGYRFTGKITSGFGWNQRIGYSLNDKNVSSASVVYGPRIFLEIGSWRGFAPHLEAEWMKTKVYSLYNNKGLDPPDREWIFTPMIGVKKSYRLFKSVRGTAFIMFNLYDPKHQSPYADVIYSRIGLEFPSLRKKTP